MVRRKGNMKLIRMHPEYPPASPLSDGEIDRDNCECVCEYDHCQDCDACGRRNRGQCDACDSRECECNQCECADYCTCENESEGLWDYNTDVLSVFSARVEDSKDPETTLLGAELEL